MVDDRMLNSGGVPELNVRYCLFILLEPPNLVSESRKRCTDRPRPDQQVGSSENAFFFCLTLFLNANERKLAFATTWFTTRKEEKRLNKNFCQKESKNSQFGSLTDIRSLNCKPSG